MTRSPRERGERGQPGEMSHSGRYLCTSFPPLYRACYGATMS